MSEQHYAYSLSAKGRIVHVGRGFQHTCNIAQEALWASKDAGGQAHIYRQADGYRFMGYYTYDGRFIDCRVPTRATA